MTRLIIIIVALTGITAALGHLRRQEELARHQIHHCLSRQTQLRRRLWDQRAQIGRLLAPSEVRDRVRRLAIDLLDEDDSPISLTQARTGEITGKLRIEHSRP